MHGLPYKPVLGLLARYMPMFFPLINFKWSISQYKSLLAKKPFLLPLQYMHSIQCLCSFPRQKVISFIYREATRCLPLPKKIPVHQSEIFDCKCFLSNCLFSRFALNIGHFRTCSLSSISIRNPQLMVEKLLCNIYISLIFNKLALFTPALNIRELYFIFIFF